jgi:hypothetical protein
MQVQMNAFSRVFFVLTGGGPLIALPSARLDAALQPTCAAIQKNMHEIAWGV